MEATKQLNATDYNVAWICVLSDVELLPSRLMLDEEHIPPSCDTNDENSYIFGSIFGHRVVVATCPKGLIGNVNAGRVVGSLFRTFPNIQMTLLVGIGGGVPNPIPKTDPLKDIHLGDVVVGWPGDGGPAVVYWDLGRSLVDGQFEMRGTIDKQEWKITSALARIASDHELHQTELNKHLARLKDHSIFEPPAPEHDRLFAAAYKHVGEYRSGCMPCDPVQLVQRPSRTEEYKDIFVFHQGRIATGNSVVRDGKLRDQISERCNGILCFEMEAAGVEIGARCLVIRGIADYADSHKNDTWKAYAAGKAAAFARELLRVIQPGEAKMVQRAVENVAARERGEQEAQYVNYFQAPIETHGKGFYGSTFNSRGGSMSF